MKYLILIMFTSSALNIFAQGIFKKAYIVSNNNDTISGLIDYTNPGSISSSCYFRNDSNSVIRAYSPTVLKSFHFEDGKLFVSKQVPYQDSITTFFLEFLLKGKVNLYYCSHKNEVLYYIEKDSILYQLSNDEEIVRINNQTFTHNSFKYIGILHFLLSDAQSLYDEIDNTKYNFTSLIKTLKDYHYQVCNDKEDCVIYYKKEKKLNDVKWQLKYGFSIDYTFTKIHSTSDMYIASSSFWYMPNNLHFITYMADFNNYQNIETNTDFINNYRCISPSFFINLNRNTNSSFQLELKYKHLKYSHVDFNLVEIPLLYKYNFLKYNRIRPFLDAGFSNSIIFNSRIKDLYVKYDLLESAEFVTDHFESTYVSHTTYINRRAPEIDGYQFNFLGGCGIKYLFSNKNSIQLELRVQSPLNYRISNYIKGGGEYKTNFQNIFSSIILSYILK